MTVEPVTVKQLKPNIVLTLKTHMQNHHLRCLQQRNNNLRYQVCEWEKHILYTCETVILNDSLLHALPYSLIFPVTLTVYDLMKQEYLRMILKTVIKY